MVHSCPLVPAASGGRCPAPSGAGHIAPSATLTLGDGTTRTHDVAARRVRLRDLGIHHLSTPGENCYRTEVLPTARPRPPLSPAEHGKGGPPRPRSDPCAMV